MTPNRRLLDTLASRGEILDYFITTFRHRNLEIAYILERGFDKVDYDNLREYLAEDEPSQAEMDADENSYMDKQR